MPESLFKVAEKFGLPVAMLVVAGFAILMVYNDGKSERQAFGDKINSQLVEMNQSIDHLVRLVNMREETDDEIGKVVLQELRNLQGFTDKLDLTLKHQNDITHERSKVFIRAINLMLESTNNPQIIPSDSEYLPAP